VPQGLGEQAGHRDSRLRGRRQVADVVVENQSGRIVSRPNWRGNTISRTSLTVSQADGREASASAQGHSQAECRSSLF
jgi:hypothetical protein